MRRLITVIISAMLGIWPLSLLAKPACKNWAVYYGDTLPPEAFKKYDLLVFDSHTHPPLNTLKDSHRLMLGYISFGEAEAHHLTDAFARENNLVVKENETWNSLIIDIRNPLWLEDVIERQIPFILHQGFHGIMIDTLDSVIYLEQTEPETYKGTIQAAANLIRAVKMHYPHLVVMVNRGFEVIPLAANDIDYVLAESTYTTYDFEKKEPRKLSESERAYYLKQFEMIRSFGIPIVSLDYWNMDDKQGVKEIYDAQRAAGVLPYVTTVDLHQYHPEPR